ncbi:MAG: hypothetical protein H6558_21235, partial [Lewinellaceae bacterium]|nr:hypothetical protein [Lewinellaceae bacterium]
MKMLTVSLLLISLFFLGAPTCSQKDAVADNRCREDSTAARITLDSLAHYFESELYSQALEMGKR